MFLYNSSLSDLEHNQFRKQDEHQVFQETWVQEKKKDGMDILPDTIFEHVEMSSTVLLESLG